jgi:Domain of unknown function (DUF4268)
MDFYPFFRGGFFLGARINTQQNVLTFGFYNSQPKPVFRYLFSQRLSIETDIGTALTWDENPTKKQSRAELRLTGTDVRDQSKWPEQHAWFLTQYERFITAFKPRVQALDVAALVAGES